jgi:PAS domain-containing protein
MPQQPIELILMRELASCLATPVFVVAPDGGLLYYNEPAEQLLGMRFEETGAMPMEEWSTVFVPTDENGDPLPPEQLPLVIALQHQRPAHAIFWIRGLDGVPRKLEVAALPLRGQAVRDLGAAAIFWEVDEK